ncbi:MAG: hypothetical protein ACI9T7_000149 [Oleiphilaceae bacterium]|jgi:hypothetical protein
MIIIELNTSAKFITSLDHETLGFLQKHMTLSPVRSGEDANGAITHWTASEAAIGDLTGYCVRSGNTLDAISITNGTAGHC